MKTWTLVLIVVLLHGAAISALLVLQGCATPGVREAPLPPVVVMPPDTPVPPVIKPVAPDTKTYTVRPGDSISRMAQRYGTSQAEIMALNKLTDPDRIRVGQELLLPGYVDIDKPAPVSKPRVTVSDGDNVYVVQQKDSISTIARRLKVSEDELVSLNKLADRNRIRVGQKLLVPDSARVPRVEEPIEAVKVEVEEAAPAVDEPFRAEIFHTVAPGQDLSSIARLYSVSVEELAELNDMSAYDEVEIGRRLRIP